jgi:hypothetical protein
MHTKVIVDLHKATQCSQGPTCVHFLASHAPREQIVVQRVLNRAYSPPLLHYFVCWTQQSAPI